MKPSLRPYLPLLHGFLLTYLWTFLAFCPFLARIGDERNRYVLFWNAQDVGIWLTCTVLAAFAVFAVDAVFNSIFRAKKPAWGSFAMLGCLALLGWHYLDSCLLSQSLRAKKLLGGALLAWLIGAFGVAMVIDARIPVRRWLQRLSHMLLPLPIVVWGAALWYPPFHGNVQNSLQGSTSIQATPVRGSFAKSDAVRPQDNVYLFVLDAWPYRLTLQDGRVVDTLPHLAEAAGSMCVFSKAHSPGIATMTSMPRLIFQRTDAYALRRGQPGFWDGAFRPCDTLPSLFSQACEAGYRTHMVGWYHPYGQMLGGSVNSVRSVSRRHWLGEGAVDRGIAFYWETAIHLLGSKTAARFNRTRHSLANRGMVYSTHALLDATQAILKDPASGQFAIFHWPVPHMPYCFDANGPKPLDAKYRLRSAKLKRRQLQYADALLGKAFQTLREMRKYDNSTIIITSDHTWVFDPKLNRKSVDERTHVPLFIKFPGQSHGIEMRGSFSNARLGRLLRVAKQADYDLDKIQAAVAAGRFHVALDDKNVHLSVDSRRHVMIVPD